MTHMKKKTIFLDRDGTLIIDRVYLNDPAQIEYLPGVFTALAALRDAGFQFVIATNQSGVAKGIITLDNLTKIHELICAEFARHGISFAGIYYAPYTSETNHPMRKPNPGMLEQAAIDVHADLPRSWMIGDRMTDVECGRRAGARGILLAGMETPADSPFPPPAAFVPSLLEASEVILREEARLERRA